MNFDEWWEDFVAEHDEWKYADSAALRRAAFQAGAASRDAEIARLKTVPMRYRRMAFNAQLQGEVARLEQENDQLRAQINVLRDAFQTFIDEHEECQDADEWMAELCSSEALHVAGGELATTPEQSLAEYRNKVIEDCAVKADALANCEENTDGYRNGAAWCAEAIRAMKENHEHQSTRGTGRRSSPEGRRRQPVRWSGLFGGNVNTSRGPASSIGTPHKETSMQIQTVEDAIEAYTAQDAWQFADREAAWKWMFEAGQKAERNECYRLAMTASEPTKGGRFNDGKWAVADAIKMRSARCDCVTCTCQPDD